MQTDKNQNRAFSGEYAFLSNMFPCFVTIDLFGMPYTFSSAEAAFQAGKCVFEHDVERIRDAKDGYAAKRIGRKVLMRKNWDEIKVDCMRAVVKAKFCQNPDMMKKLKATEGRLVETNTWHDTFWGVCGGVGENWLGRILMEIREGARR